MPDRCRPMTRTSSRASLLHVAVQDLHQGKLDLSRRLPGLAPAFSDPDLRTMMLGMIQQAGVHCRRLADLGGDGGPTNLWMAGILDDAQRDAKSHQRGALLDIALIGAVRKALAAEIVSFDTAIALCQAMKARAAEAVLAAIQQEDRALDDGLVQRLAALT